MHQGHAIRARHESTAQTRLTLQQTCQCRLQGLHPQLTTQAQLGNHVVGRAPLFCTQLLRQPQAALYRRHGLRPAGVQCLQRHPGAQTWCGVNRGGQQGQGAGGEQRAQRQFDVEFAAHSRQYLYGGEGVTAHREKDVVAADLGAFKHLGPDRRQTLFGMAPGCGTGLPGCTRV